MTAPLSLAYSPCPNDTFVFAAWTNGLLEGAPPVDVVLDDVEALNAAARRGEHALTKVSYGAIPYLTERYRILRAGGALGRGCGPLLIAKPGPDGAAPALSSLKAHARIAIPGELTTAYLLLRLAHQRPIDAVVMRFDAIVDAVARGEVDAGLIIHESRFTYQSSGLTQVVDLGQWWEDETGRPIPLGAILVRRDLDETAALRIDATIRASLAFAYANGAAVAPYVREHAFEMDEEVMRKHIALYVNGFTRDVGDEGLAAVEALFEYATAARLVPPESAADFVGTAKPFHSAAGA
jgi:1,4-dihydroxy-6-naphthoate synthase